MFSFFCHTLTYKLFLILNTCGIIFLFKGPKICLLAVGERVQSTAVQCVDRTVHCSKQSAQYTVVCRACSAVYGARRTMCSVQHSV